MTNNSGQDNKRFLCIHNHFYQPPRENPWLEEIEYQESAHPYHDWNERISAECYGPNGQSRLLDHDRWVFKLSNNYSKISFNFGPTLLSWMENYDQEAYEAILEGDKLSIERTDGHGSAIAQAYNHIILPLANRRDKETQVIWGLRDFEKRFGREAEAMWLPETAVDTETLEILSDHGMKYVILAPRQAKAVRPLDSDQHWSPVTGETIDPKVPYLVRLPSGREIAAFFYDGPISQAVAFEKLLHNGESFAKRLMQGFDYSDNSAQLLNIATDGETYGHHHPNGDMALAYALYYIERNNLARVTNYAEYLAQHPPRHEAQVHDNSSWSCVHGVERWRSDCGCNSGMCGDWRQGWRAPLREACDLLRDKLEKPYEKYMADYTKDPWKLRNEYIEIISKRAGDNRKKFYKKHLGKEAPFTDAPDEEQRFLRALEIQRHLLLMYTSCAWFFDEISGIETVQNLQYAWHALTMADDVFNVDLREEFLAILAKAPSNIPGLGQGDEVVRRYVLPAMVNKRRITAHYAACALFDETEELEQLYCFDFEPRSMKRHYSGKAKLLWGDVDIISRITFSRQRFEFCVMHLGDHNISVGVRKWTDRTRHEDMIAEFVSAFDRGDFAESLRLMDRNFPDDLYSLKDLFKDQQKAIVDSVMTSTMDTLESHFSELYEQHYPIMCYLKDIGMGFPAAFEHISEFVQNKKIKKSFAEDPIQLAPLQRYLDEARNWSTHLDTVVIAKKYVEALHRIFDRITEHDEEGGETLTLDLEELNYLYELLETGRHFAFNVDFGQIQNDFYKWLKELQERRPENYKEVEPVIEKISRILKVRIPY